MFGSAADLSVAAIAPATATVGDPVLVTVTARNDGPDEATVQVAAPLGAGLTLDSSTPDLGTYAAGSGQWSLTLGSGATATLHLAARATDARSSTTTAEVAASSAGDPDSIAGNGAAGEDDSASAAIEIAPAPPPPAPPTPPSSDKDGDGVAPPLDCNDTNSAIRPGAIDPPGDGIDQNCDGVDSPFPVLGASAVFTSSVARGVTRLLRLRAVDLSGGEKIVVTCKGKGCPRKKKDKTKTFTARKPGVLSIIWPALKRAKLRAKATVRVEITKAGSVGRVSVATFQKGTRAPKIARSCLVPGARRTSACQR